MLSGRVYQLLCILLVKLLINLPSTQDTEVNLRSRGSNHRPHDYKFITTSVLTSFSILKRVLHHTGKRTRSDVTRAQ